METRQREETGGKWDIDYHVTFPSDTHPDGIGVEEAEEGPIRRIPSVDPSEKEPVVILLGWAGCTDRNLSKYSAIYAKRCITIRYTAPNSDIFFRSDNLQKAAEKILELIVDLDLESNPVFVHCFSNGGGYVYRWISEFIPSRAEFRNIRLAGAIFDSCPGRSRLLRGTKVLMMTSKHSTIVKYCIAFLFICFALSRRCLLAILNIFGWSSPPVYWDAIQNDPSVCPQLYLYSKADDLVSHHDVEDQIATRKRRGIDVQSVCWEDSGHVVHLLKHRESYIKSCLDFIDYASSSASAAF